jgi:hypothetical protein
MSALKAATSHPTDRSSRTDIAKEVLVIARRVLENVDAGRVYPAGTVEWAKQIVNGNRSQQQGGRPESAALGPAELSRAHGASGARA